MELQINLFESDTTPEPTISRTEQQANRKIAYDVGEKIGGARKDEYALKKQFQDRQTVSNLKDLESCSPITAAEMVTKKELFKSFSLENEKEKEIEPAVARIKQLIIQRVIASPSIDSAEGREKFLLAAEYIQNEMKLVKTLDDLINFVYKIRDQIHNEKITDSYMNKKEENLNHLLVRRQERNDPCDDVLEQLEKTAQLKLDIIHANHYPLSYLGTKFTNFFVKAKSANATINKVMNTVNNWDDLLKVKKTTTKRATAKPAWERKLPGQPVRTGGTVSKVQSPEQLMKAFGFRAVEFGHYLNDEIGGEHVLRCSEALYDLSDVLDTDHYYNVSLNGSLAMAFGSRGRGKALGHYEPASKVINLTRDKGALGVTAHEWFHGATRFATSN